MEVDAIKKYLLNMTATTHNHAKTCSGLNWLDKLTLGIVECYNWIHRDKTKATHDFMLFPNQIMGNTY